MYWHDDGDMAPESLHSLMTCSRGGGGRGVKGRKGEGERGRENREGEREGM